MYSTIPPATILPPSSRNPLIPITYTPRPWPPPPPPPPPSPSSFGNIPILVVTIVGVLVAAILMLGYYLFADWYCFWRRRSDALDRSQRRLRDDLMMFVAETRGLGQSEIRQIPTFLYRKETDDASTGGGGGGGGGDCAVCLGEFQEEETVRLLPDCFHVFHVDCIDTWLQSNANCPLCRASISPEAAVPVDKLPAFLRSRGLQGTRSGDVAIDVRDDEPEVDRRRQLRRHASTGARPRQPAARPMRRSFSVDMAAAADGRLFREVQKNLWQNPHFREAATPIGRGGEGSSSAARIRWGLFPFHRRSSSAAALS